MKLTSCYNTAASQSFIRFIGTAKVKNFHRKTTTFFLDLPAPQLKTESMFRAMRTVGFYLYQVAIHRLQPFSRL